jgi:hypothetical protein
VVSVRIVAACKPSMSDQTETMEARFSALTIAAIFRRSILVASYDPARYQAGPYRENSICDDDRTATRSVRFMAA